MLPENAYLYALTKVRGLGPKRIRELLAAYDHNPAQAYAVLREGRLKNFFPFLQQHVPYLPGEEELANLYQQAISGDMQICGIQEPAYPALLKEIPDAPPLLFYRGTLPGKALLITVVGTRAMTLYGARVVADLVTPLAAQGIGIVSGLAFGIDAESHLAAMRASGYTAAVLGSSADVITPARHEYLAHQILESGGCLLSEFPPGTKAEDGSFPRRNRILAGLSPVTLVIEAAEKSGALITANYAAGYHREVAAIPGSIHSPMSAGCHKLLRGGAALITRVEDLISILQVELLPRERPKPANLTEAQAAVYTLLGTNPKAVDILAEEFDGHSAELFALLTELELLGVIKQMPGQGYVITPHGL